MGAKNYLDIAEGIVKKATQNGANLAEAYLVKSKELSIEVRDGAVETMKLAEDCGAGLRIIKGGRIGFAFTTDLTTDGVEEVVKGALANAQSTEQDQYHTLPAPTDNYPQLDLYDADIVQATVEQKIKLAVDMEQAAREYDRRIKIIETSSYRDGESEVFIVNSNGLAASYKACYCGLYAALVATEGEDSQTGFAIDYNLKYKGIDPVKTGQRAAQKAVRMLGAKPIPTQRMAVVLDPYVATNFLGLLESALTGEAVQKGRSLFAGKVDQRVAADIISIVDDGARPGGIASAPFDGEGVPSSKTVLIQQGVLRGYLHNSYTAAKAGVKSTGNGVRYSFKSTPEVGTTNFYIDAGVTDPSQMVAEIERGIYITEVMGMHTANPISGDFSLGAAGILIEQGKFTIPVRGIAIAGNVMELLSLVDTVGNDLQFYGRHGAPTLRISHMTVSGK